MFSKYNVLIRGGGDLATAVAHKLYRVGFNVIISELEVPVMVRRNASFANCVYEGVWSVEDVEAIYVKQLNEIPRYLKEGKIIVSDISEKELISYFKPVAFIDATISKKSYNIIHYAPIVIGMGPGFEAGIDAHAVIETNRGHNLGKLIFKGKAEANTGIPGNIQGCTSERVLRSNEDGVIKHNFNIGDFIEKGDVVSTINGNEIIAEIDGVLRGLIHENVDIVRNQKVGDIDPRSIKEYCNTISDKGRTIAGGALEALLILLYNYNKK